MLREMRAGVARFWYLPNKVKWPIIIVVAFFLIGISAAATGGSSSDKPKAADAASLSSASDAGTRTWSAIVTNTPKPTETPRPTATPTPKPPTPTPEPAGFSFGEGQKIVGTDLTANVTYRTRSKASSNCYWERQSGLGGTFDEILANEITSGFTVVTIGATDKGFKSSGCPKWTQNLSPVTSAPTDPFSGDGTYIVGVDIAPGTWRADSIPDSCYWQRMSTFGGAGISGIIANGNVKGSAVVTIAASDKGFKSSNCGTWAKVQ